MSRRRREIPSPPENGEQLFVDSGPADGPPDALVLDIGGDVGALVLFADESCLGEEIDLSPAGRPHRQLTHTMIRRRRAFDREVIAGVYPELAAGDYTVWGLDDRALGDVTITGGRVTEFWADDCRVRHDERPM